MYSNQIFRASSMKDIMTGVAKSWTVEDSLTCKRKLVQIHRENSWKRRKDTGNKYTDKGTEVEVDSITLFSRVKKALYIKNEVRLNDSYFTGEPDLFLGESVSNAEIIVDIKSSWDWTTFPSMLDEDSKDYFYQAQTYMALSGAKAAIIAHCLVNTPADKIIDEKKRLQWKMQVVDVDAATEDAVQYREQCKEIEKNHIYDLELFRKHYPHFDFHNDISTWEYDIPMKERVHEIFIERDEKAIAQMQARVMECRIWMNENLFNNTTE